MLVYTKTLLSAFSGIPKKHTGILAHATYRTNTRSLVCVILYTCSLVRPSLTTSMILVKLPTFRDTIYYTLVKLPTYSFVSPNATHSMTLVKLPSYSLEKSNTTQSMTLVKLPTYTFVTPSTTQSMTLV